MIEAQIICTCPSIWIQDLNLNMKRGQSAMVSESKAKASTDLGLARRNGGVSITYVQRFQELKPPQVEPVVQVSKKVPLPTPLHQPESPVLPAERVRVERMTLDEDALVDKLAAKMNSLRSSNTNSLIDSLIGEVQAMRKEFSEGQKNHGQIVKEVVHSEGRVKEDVPMFIPKTIMGKKAGDVKIEIEETTSESTVDEASEALRALRKKEKS